jgi:hypothetical protein
MYSSSLYVLRSCHELGWDGMAFVQSMIPFSRCCSQFECAPSKTFTYSLELDRLEKSDILCILTNVREYDRPSGAGMEILHVTSCAAKRGGHPFQNSPPVYNTTPQIGMQRLVPQRARQLWGHAPRVRSFNRRYRAFATVSSTRQYVQTSADTFLPIFDPDVDPTMSSLSAVVMQAAKLLQRQLDPAREQPS